MTTRSEILQCRLTKQEKADFKAAATTQRGRWGNAYAPPTPSEVLRNLVLEFIKAHRPKDVEK